MAMSLCAMISLLYDIVWRSIGLFTEPTGCGSYKDLILAKQLSIPGHTEPRGTFTLV